MATEKTEVPFTVQIDNLSLTQARAAYFRPDNPATSLTSFYNKLLDLAETDQRLVSATNPQVIAALQYIFTNLDQARKFDERYLGHMLTETSIPALLSYILALRVGSNTVAEEVSRQETKLEPEAIRWMTDLIGFDPETSGGTFTSGGSLANTTALWVARELASEKFSGKKNPPKLVVLANPFVHYSVEKSVRILRGPYKDSIEMIKLPSQNLALDPRSLEEAILDARSQGKEIMAIVAIAGETETGVVDDLNSIADLAQKYDVFLHVDAAYGLPYMMSSRADLFDGIHRADSVTFDPHKALNTPYSAGAVLFRDRAAHSRVQFRSSDAEYVFKNGVPSLGQKRIEGSMGAGAIVSTVAAIRSLNKPQWHALLDHTLNNIEYLYHRLAVSPILMPIHRPDLNVLCFTLRPDYCREHGIFTNEDLKRVIDQTSGTLWDETGYFFSTTKLPVDNSVETLEEGAHHQYVYRAVPMNPRTELTHIEEAVLELEARVQSYFQAVLEHNSR